MSLPLLFPSTSELTARQAARELGVSAYTVRRLIHMRPIPARSVGRSYLVSRNDLEAYRRRLVAAVGSAA